MNDDREFLYTISATVIIVFIVMALGSFSPFAIGDEKINEAWYVKRFCTGTVEYRLPDAGRVDCLEDEYAIEYDYAKKWSECIGQALEYGRVTKRKAACALILKEKGDFKHYHKMVLNIEHYKLPVSVFIVDASRLTIRQLK